MWFETCVMIFIYIFKCSGYRHCFNVVALSFARTKNSRGVLTDTAMILALFLLRNFAIFIC